MINKLKNISIGLVIGILVTGTFTFVFAEDIVTTLTAYKNQYPIYVNAVQSTNIDAVKIGDYNYVKIADVSKLLNNVEVSFNETKQQIDINTNKTVEDTTIIPDTTTPETPTGTTEITVPPDIITKTIGETITFDGLTIKINSIIYNQKYETLVSDEQEVFAIVNCDIFTENIPPNNMYWFSNNFFNEAKTVSGIIIPKSNMLSTGENMFVDINKDNNINFAIRISKTDIISEIVIINPVNKQKITIIN